MWPIPRFAIGPQMRIQNVEAVRDGVVYVGFEANGRFTPLGTGFLIVHYYDETHAFFFVVTAAHVIKSVPGETVYVRLNRKNGDASSVAVPGMAIHGWDEYDIALIPLNIGTDVFDFKILNLDEEALRKSLEHFQGICLGDEVYAVGLYTSHYGLTKNIPVVRVGHVALLPGEPVRGPGGYVSAYLVELRTIAGLSGSPVYLNPPPVRVREKKLEHLDGTHFPIIGVLVGYHVVESKEDQVVVSKFQAHDGDEEPKDTDSLDQRNTGFGIVVPIDPVFKMLKGMRPIMKRAVENSKKEGGFRPASASISPSPKTSTADQNAPDDEHRERFNRLLGAAVKPPKSSDQT